MRTIKALSLATLFALTGLFGSGLLASEAHAAMTKDEAKCRSTIFKTTSKYQAGAWKAVAGCHKGKLKGKVGAGVDCNDPIQADIKGKLGKAASKIRDSLGGAKDKCADKTTGDALSNVLAVYGRCPSPGEITDDGGATDGIDDFSELADCLIAVSDSLIGLTASEVMGDPDHASLSKDLAKCQGTIGKSTAKLMATISKERGKCQAGADKAGGNIDWTCGSFDGKGKIASTGQKFKDGITKACLGDEDTLDALDSCGDTPAQLQACLVDTIAAKVGNGMTAMLFELPGVCPSGVQVTTLAGFGQQRTSTELSLGWTGLAHGVDILDGWVGEANLACDTDCDNCAVSILPVDKSMGNCRCDNDPTISCDEPFSAEDADDCGAGNECICRFGPPLALSSAGVPVCVLTQIAEELTGSADAGTALANTTIQGESSVYTGITVTQPCPTCDGGTCNGGPRDGLACAVDAVHPTFGNSSFDCQPDPGTRIPGTVKTVLNTTTENSSLGFDLTCDPPLAATACACAVCSGDSTVACNSDAECAAVGAGLCDSNGGGSARFPNACLDGVCSDSGDGVHGVCDTSPTSQFCDGQLRANGDGYIPCSSDADCDALDPECDGGDCGNCGGAALRSCFLDPITVSGDPGLNSSSLVATWCTPPTSNSAVNNAGGSPGPGRLDVRFDFTGYCPDGVTEFETPGGSNCP